MNYRIEKKEAFRVMGVAAPLAKEIEQNFAAVPELWQKGSHRRHDSQAGTAYERQMAGVLGVSACMAENEWRYYLAVATEDALEEGWEEYTVPAFTWAIFEGTGQCPQAIQELEKRIVTEWLPSSGYEYDNGPDVELYISPDPMNAKFEVWIPVVKKQ